MDYLIRTPNHLYYLHSRSCGLVLWLSAWPSHCMSLQACFGGLMDRDKRDVRLDFWHYCPSLLGITRISHLGLFLFSLSYCIK